MGVQVSRIADFVASHEDTAPLVSNFGCFSKFSFKNFNPHRTPYTNLCIAFLPYKAMAGCSRKPSPQDSGAQGGCTGIQNS